MILLMFRIILEMIRNKRKKFAQMKHVHGPTSLIVSIVKKTMLIVPKKNEITAF